MALCPGSTVAAVDVFEGVAATRPAKAATATIPAKQSSRTEVKRPLTLKSPLPRYSGDVGSAPIARAMAGRARLLVIDTRSPQIASPKRTAITIRPIHFLESAGDDSGTDVLRIATTAWLPSAIVTHPRVMRKAAQNKDLC